MTVGKGWETGGRGWPWGNGREMGGPEGGGQGVVVVVVLEDEESSGKAPVVDIAHPTSHVEVVPPPLGKS